MAVNLKARIDDFKASIDRLSSRERLMVGGLGLVVVLGFVVGIGFWILLGLGDREEQNQNIRQALKDLSTYQDEYVQARRELAAFEVLMSRDPLELNSYVEKAASAVGIAKIDESDMLESVNTGRYVQKGILVKLRKVTLGQLASFLKKLEDSRTHIVQVTGLSVTTRWGGQQNQNLDAELTISTYDRQKVVDDSEKGQKRRKRSRSS
ncbi:MAG: hypothetical protein V1754_09320 [Pseudomonadota bacterium]